MAGRGFQKITKRRTFEIDYDNNQFLKDGEPFTYVSGEMHYFRIPHAYWKDRLEKLKVAGCDTVSTYVEWSFHEPSPEIYEFTGDRDVSQFLSIAQELDLNVILRPGPYIGADRDFGGYPSWLLTKNPSMKLRTTDATHTFFVKKWFEVLMQKIQPHLYGNGGNIIMVQVENEYGSCPVNDINYLIWLRDLLRNYIGVAAILFTTDEYSNQMILRGRIPGVLSTIDLSPTNVSTEIMFDELRNIQPKGPLVISELYVREKTAFFLGHKAARTDIEPIVKTITWLMERNISFNMYMFHGGTNFGFTTGTEIEKRLEGSEMEIRVVYFGPSYDYDDPISEAGDLTPKYEAIRDVILKNRKQSSPLTLEKVKQKGNYGKVDLKPVCSLFSCPIGVEYPPSEGPMSFEALGQSYGFVSYSANVTGYYLALRTAIRDMAYIYVDDEEKTFLEEYTDQPNGIQHLDDFKGSLRLLVENMGRRYDNVLSNCTKGLLGNSTSGKTHIIKNWHIKGYPFSPEDVTALGNLEPIEKVPLKLPAVFKGQFVLEENQEPLDTFINTKNWIRGIVFVNEYNLGRYWWFGPLRTLYVPAVFLRKYPANNTVILVELHPFYIRGNRSVYFLDSPINRTFQLL